ncbi:MAG: 2-amino-4-hydroxy-6-hydroxymethyldihydropteridine diphosphokinase [Alphaproteobacteria bacterium]
MILVALGSNLPSIAGESRSTLEAATASLDTGPTNVVARSRVYRSAPVPPSGQPDFMNAVIALSSTLAPESLMDRLHTVETQFGRRRRDRWEARTLDLDLIDYHQFVTIGASHPETPDWPVGALVLPHPRMHQRAFVLRPLLDIVPNWVHPLLQVSARALLDTLGDDQICEPIP